MRTILPILGLFGTELVYASPFTTKKDTHYYHLSVGQTTADDLAKKNSEDENRGKWEDSDFTIVHNAFQLKWSRGLSEKSDFTVGVTYKSIKNNGKWGPQQSDDSFSGWSDFSFEYKRMVFNKRPYFVALLSSYEGPGSNYNPNKLVTPGNAVPVYSLGLNSAWLSASNEFMLGLNLAQAFRAGDRAKDQSKYYAYFYYMSKPGISFGAFFGGVQTQGGIDIGSPEWASMVPGESGNGHDGGNYGMPFARLNEAYRYAGASLSYSHLQSTVSLSYTQKLLDGAKNTDINSSVALTLGYRT